MKRAMLVLAWLVFAVVPVPSIAALLEWSATLTGAEEAPPNNSTATGFASGSFDTESHVITWNVSAQGLSAPATVGHFHAAAPPNVAAPVVVNFDLGALAGNTSGAFSGAADLDGDPALAPAFDDVPLSERIAQLLGGLWYANLHNSEFPGGEIRGQVIFAALPEPASILLLAMVLAVLVLVRARR